MLDFPIQLRLFGQDRRGDAQATFGTRLPILEHPLPTPDQLLQDTWLIPLDNQIGLDDRKKRSNHPVGPNELVSETPGRFPRRLVCYNSAVHLLYLLKHLLMRV